MKKLFLAFYSMLFLIGCSNDNIFAPREITIIDDLEFEVTHTEIDCYDNDYNYDSDTGTSSCNVDTYNTLILVTNKSNEKLFNRWDISVSFYTDSSFQQFIGVTTRQVHFPLEPEETRGILVGLILPDSVNVFDYPNFAVKDIYGYWD